MPVNKRNSSTSHGPTNGNSSKEDPWICQMCENVFSEPDARVLECQRCKQHFCIKCLNKPKAEYDILSKSDTMRFCIKCRQIIEEHIIIDLKIEERCNQIMKMYDERITKLEDTVNSKCDEARVREIIQEELIPNRSEPKVHEIVQEELTNLALNEQENTNKKPKTETVTTVLGEINERKSRENNLVIFGMKEIESEVSQERIDYDVEQVTKLFQDCKITLEDGNIRKTKRLGKYNKEKPYRPVLVQMLSVESKLVLFKNIHKIKKIPKYEKVNVSNDLTKAEREQEKLLWEQAKKMQAEDVSGDFLYKVRGHPGDEK